MQPDQKSIAHEADVENASRLAAEPTLLGPCVWSRPQVTPRARWPEGGQAETFKCWSGWARVVVLAFLILSCARRAPRPTKKSGVEQNALVSNRMRWKYTVENGELCAVYAPGMAIFPYPVISKNPMQVARTEREEQREGEAAIFQRRRLHVCRAIIGDGQVCAGGGGGG